MRKLFLLISFFAATLSLNAQTTDDKYGPNKEECLKYISYYEEYFKQKNYESAIPNWRKAYELCPVTSRYSILQNGTTLMRYLIKKNELNPAYKDKLIDSLMVIYKKRIEFWPKYKTNTLNYYATDMYNYLQDKPEALYKGLTEVIDQLGSKTDMKTFPLYMSIACNLYKEGKVESEEVFSVYEKSMKYLGEVNTEGNEIKKRLVDKTTGDVDAVFGASGVADTDNLVAIYSPKFEADPANVELAKSIASKLAKTEGGTDTDLFVKTMTVWYNNEPSASSAYMLYKLNSSRGDINNAYKYLEEAINSADSDPETDAGYYFELAAFAYKNGNNPKAIEAAEKAIEISDSTDGKAYMLIGTIWGSVVCQGNEIEQRAKYWVATDYMQKAKNADASLAADCNNYISQYRVYYPQTAEAFMYDLTDGQSYTFSCAGMRATTTVRTQK